MADTQELIVSLTLRDNLSLGVGRAKDALGNLGDAASLQAIKTSNAFASAADRIRGSFAGIGADIQKGIGLGLGIGTVQLVSKGVSELTDFLKDSVKAAADEEAGIKRLGQTLAANVKNWQGNTDAIEAAVTERQHLGFADDELRDSLGRLVAATHDVNQALSIQSVAMDLARFKGVSLATATDALVHIEAGRYRGLADLGIQLKAGATQTEALAAVERVASGQADVFSTTFAGAMARASVSIHNLQEDIGTGLLPILTDILDKIDHIASTDLPSFAKHSADEIGELEKGLRFLASPLGNLADIFRPTNDGITALLNKVPPLTEAETAAAVAATEHGRAMFLASEAADGEVASTDDATAASLRYAAATTGAITGTEAVSAAKAYLALVDKDLADKENAIVDAFGRIFIPAKQAPKIFGDVADAATGAGDELLVIEADANAAAFALAGIPKDTQINITYVTSDIHRNIVENTADTSDDAMRFAVAQHNIQFDIDQAARDQAVQDEKDRKNKEALAQAKADAADYAQVLEGKLNKALSAAKDLATSLFDKLHERHLQAIADTEKLAEKQHDAATQAISDALKASLSRDAAPVTEAEKAQSDIEISRQNRDLHASLTAAQQTGDPEQIRRAQEALQSFQAAQNIAYLKEQQARQDLAATKDAADKQKVADDLLATAKTEQAAAIKAETDRNKKQVSDFERDLAALKKRDEGASPSKVKTDITALERKYGITTDAQGRHHIEDSVVTAIKSLKFPVPRLEFYATIVSPPIYLGARQVAAALASNQSPAATPGVRTGILTPARG